jgi:ABC-2 type transport system ATP-binding protein
MADVEALCKRVIVIHHGKLLFDGDLAGLITRFAPHKTIVVDLEAGAEDPTAALQRAMDESGGHVVEQARERITVQVPRSKTAQVTTRLLAELPVVDLVVEEPAVDEVIDRVFAVPAEEAAAAAGATPGTASAPAAASTPPDGGASDPDLSATPR